MPRSVMPSGKASGSPTRELNGAFPALQICRAAGMLYRIRIAHHRISGVHRDFLREWTHYLEPAYEGRLNRYSRSSRQTRTRISHNVNSGRYAISAHKVLTPDIVLLRAPASDQPMPGLLDANHARQMRT